MTGRPKRVPRLWCALQGLLPLEHGFARQNAERLLVTGTVAPENERPGRIRVAAGQATVNGRPRDAV